MKGTLRYKSRKHYYFSRGWQHRGHKRCLDWPRQCQKGYGLNFTSTVSASGTGVYLKPSQWLALQNEKGDHSDIQVIQHLVGWQNPQCICKVGGEVSLSRCRESSGIFRYYVGDSSWRGRRIQGGESWCFSLVFLTTALRVNGFYIFLAFPQWTQLLCFRRYRVARFSQMDDSCRGSPKCQFFSASTTLPCLLNLLIHRQHFHLQVVRCWKPQFQYQRRKATRDHGIWLGGLIGSHWASRSKYKPPVSNSVFMKPSMTWNHFCGLWLNMQCQDKVQVVNTMTS